VGGPFDEKDDAPLLWSCLLALFVLFYLFLCMNFLMKWRSKMFAKSAQMINWIRAVRQIILFSKCFFAIAPILLDHKRYATNVSSQKGYIPSCVWMIRSPQRSQSIFAWFSNRVLALAPMLFHKKLAWQRFGQTKNEAPPLEHLPLGLRRFMLTPVTTNNKLFTGSYILHYFQGSTPPCKHISQPICTLRLELYCWLGPLFSCQYWNTHMMPSIHFWIYHIIP
jgi:hypothetical protein